MRPVASGATDDCRGASARSANGDRTTPIASKAYDEGEDEDGGDGTMGRCRRYHPAPEHATGQRLRAASSTPQAHRRSSTVHTAGTLRWLWTLAWGKEKTSSSLPHSVEP